MSSSFDFSHDPENPNADRDIIDISDLALAEILIRMNRGVVRYVSEWGKWLVWDGMRWRIDVHNLVEGMAHQVVREVSKRLANQRFIGYTSRGGKFEPHAEDRTEDRRYKERKAKRAAVLSVASLKSASKRYGILAMASAEPGVVAPVDTLDADQWLLNTPKGIVDLRNGSMHAHKPSMLMTKITRVAPSSEPPERWLRFLDEITAGDTDLQAYLQRVAGYCLTGTTNAQTLFFGFGSGANGKSVFVNTISHLMMDYYSNAEIETFLDLGQQNRHSTEVANLQGARFVTASETQSGRAWNESRIKQMTGGDPVTARFIYKDVFTYTPQFKLFIIGNHRPRLSAVNEAIRRRMQLIPFTVTFERQDEYLKDYLIEFEAGGILQWMIEGCLEYRRIKLQPPPAVAKATAEYLNAEDVMKQWLEECCVWDPNSFTPSRDLFRSWTTWAIKANETIGHERDFKLALFEHCGENHLEHKPGRWEGEMTRGYKGIRLLTKAAKQKAE